MAQVGFYHLTRTGLEAALPALLARTLAAGARAVVRGTDPARIEALDAALWLAPGVDWLPHGTAAMGHGPDQPVWLTTGDDVPNDARFLFLVDGATADLARFERVFDLFDGNDPDAVAAARARWKAARAAGHALTYWQQGETGWIRQAEVAPETSR
ncbi:MULTISPECIES: DNA polymerase III subunit chi [Acidiphilium]|jgi:DNA polymerase-3 subunit chi|uniref:DNA polymerase III subunit chi n=1 Tax=Acidiphilium TaxID=522 RepID=UPI000460D881|nr:MULTISPECIES: DNA polymerase III subunit chi [Acidiphilium]MBU6356687.1 DNA polymerase III subunit chi [Rhodospirillales bacterium]KDM65997.1 putative DNA polymerase III chi subunit [Acidiphilium sp. JA12-A1]MBS3024939.1 DNA polymerase III subunit chi [Acidiphilium multivorum]MDE2328763.1 DNA polymerase III subunit chi [Rhodospirillales bacterium]UNC14041.1 DNA polymerase III subunit chi [Acidiphilium multivorum]